MPLPSKQEEIYTYLLNDIRDYYPGAKLPTERLYAQRLGVARQTLRSSLQRLEAEKRITREKSGTYVLDEATGRRPEAKCDRGPVNILLPCPDYTESVNDSSVISHQSLIRGAMRAAVEFGTQVVTIPVSETNDPDNINWNQLAGLRKNDIVLFAGHWFQPLIPLLMERKCRIGCILNDAGHMLNNISDCSDIDYIEYRRPDSGSISRKIRFLCEKGASSIGCFMASNKINFSDCIDLLFPRLLAEFPFLRSENLRLTDVMNPFRRQLDDLKDFCKGKRFDGLIVDMTSFREPYVDLYRELELSPSTLLIVESTVFFDPLNPKRNANIWVHSQPFAETGFELAKSLLSGWQGQDVRVFDIKLKNRRAF